MGFSFDTSQLTTNMTRMRVRVVKEGKRRAVRAGARVIAKAMVEAAPVQTKRSDGSNSLPPGEMKKHIRARTTTDNSGEPVGLAGPDGNVQHVAEWVEYGHREVSGGKSEVLADGRTRGPGKVHEQDVPAHPFLRPAYESSATAALDAVGAALREELQGI